MKDLLIENEDISIGPNGKLGYIDFFKHYIDTIDTKCTVWFCKSFAEKDAIEKDVNHLLQEDKIQLSQSYWASSVVLVKKNGTLHFCINYQGLNSMTKKGCLFPTSDRFMSGCLHWIKMVQYPRSH